MSFRDRARRKLQERAQGQSGDGDAPADGQDQQTEPSEGEQAASVPAQADYTAELEQLAQLKEQGILTEEEFTAKKDQILGI